MRRLTITTAGAVCMAVLAGLVVGGPATADIRADIDLRCTGGEFAKGRLHVEAKAPQSGAVGRRMGIGPVVVTLTTPLRPAGEATVTNDMEAHLAVVASQGGATTDAGWPRLALEKHERSGSNAVLTFTGRPPALTPHAPGDVTLVAQQLTVTGRKEGSPSASEFRCRPDPASAVLATVPVTGSGSPVSPRTPPPAANVSNPDPAVPDCTTLPKPGEPGGGLNPHPDLRVQPLDLDGEVDDKDPAPFQARCAKIAGFVNSAKLRGALPLAGDTQIRRNAERLILKDPTNYLFEAGYLVAHTAPSRATMLGFRFLPTTATTVQRQVSAPGANGSRVANYGWHNAGLGRATPTWGDFAVDSKAFVRAQVTKIAVNGVELDPGSRCRTSRLDLKTQAFMGNPRIGGLDLFQDGARHFTHTLAIPPFTGCGVGEDLSPILTATVSGTGNSTWIQQSEACIVNTQPCNEQEREPVTWTVDPGGPTIATARPFSIKSRSSRRAVITCEWASLALTLKGGDWLNGLQLGKVTDASFGPCVMRPNGNDDAERTPVSLSAVTKPSADLHVRPTDERTPFLVVNDMPAIKVTRRDDGCAFTMPDRADLLGLNGTYADNQWETRSGSLVRGTKCGHSFFAPAVTDTSFELKPGQSITVGKEGLPKGRKTTE